MQEPSLQPNLGQSDPALGVGKQNGASQVSANGADSQGQEYVPSLQALVEAAEVDFESPDQSRHDDLEATAALVGRDLRASKPDGTHTPANAARHSLSAQIAGVSGKMSLADGGQFRWYGPTSNRHFSIGAPPPPIVGQPRNLNDTILKALAAAGESDKLDARLETRLLSLYFIWHNAFFHIVNQEIFMKHRALYLSGSVDCPYFSLTLYYAILAYSAIFSDEAIALAGGCVEKSGDVFSKRARICLEAEMDHPRETTVQALAILGSFEVCVGRDARG